MDCRRVSVYCVFLSCCLVLAGTPAVGSVDVTVADSPADRGTASSIGPELTTVPATNGRAGDGQPESGSILQEDQPEADNTVTRIELAPDGSATWTLRIRTRLDTDASVTSYRQFQETFRANTSRYLDTFERRMTGVVSNANESFAREMRATGFEANTSIQEVPQRWGVVTYRFTWHGFAAIEDDRIVVGDVFAGGFFIAEDDALEIAVPDGYVVDEAVPTPAQSREGVVEWRGREDFADGRPHVVAVPEGDGGFVFGFGPLVPALFVSLVLVVTIVAVGVTSRRDPDGNPIAAIKRRLGSDGSGEPLADDSSGGATASPEASDPATEELLTDEDRVEALLAEYGGRMKQGDVVEELGWSKSKTSRVLSSMAEEGRIRKLRIGRENLIEERDDEQDDSTDERDERQQENTHRWEK